MAGSGPGLGIIKNGAIASIDGRIAFVGARSELPAGVPARETISLQGQWITPGLIDCHTHIVYAGNRAAEWEMRLAGASYQDIARAGGGILSSVQAVRAANDEALRVQALARLDRLMAEGVTTIEAKSGYGLDLANEVKMLTVARSLGDARAIRVVTTFLGAHALPPDGPAGLKVLESGRRIDLLITDVGLPGGMNGRQLADAARRTRADLPVLFITGYAESAVVQHDHLDPGMAVLAKPFQIAALAERVRGLIKEEGLLF